MWRKLWMLMRRGRAESELDQEIRLHLELREQRLREFGLSGREARDEAARQFGNRTRAAEATRDEWSWMWLEQTARDLRLALRAVRRYRAFSAVAIASLAAALGVNTAVFGFARAILLEKLRAPGSGRLVILRQHNEMFHMENCCFSSVFFRELRKQDAGLEDALAVHRSDVNLSDQDHAEKSAADIVSGNYFSMLGARPAAGRLIDESDDTAGSRVCVISYRLWQERFAGRADAIGRKVTINTTPFEIVGVTPDKFTGVAMYTANDVVIPVGAADAIFGGPAGDNMVWLEIVARLKPGITPAQEESRLNSFGRAIQKKLGMVFSEKDVFRVEDGSQGIDSKRERLGQPVMLLFGLSGIVLVLACANLTALLLVRSLERSTEIGVRLSLGGSRAALVRQFLCESMVLASCGGVAGWWVARVLTRALLGLMGADAAELAPKVGPDGATFAFLAAVTIAAGAAFGVIPAWRGSRFDPLRAIRGGESGRARLLASRVLIGGQIALSLVLLMGAGLFLRTLEKLRAVDPGFRPDNVALLRIDLSRTVYGNSGAAGFFNELLRRARELPETRAASLSNLSVLSGAMQSIVVRVPGYVPPDRLLPVAYFESISGGYFRTLGIPLIAGRDFNEYDRAAKDSEGVAIVNERFARDFMSGDALGKTFSFGGWKAPVRIVGVVGNVRIRGLREELKAVMYVPVTQWTYPQGEYLQVRFAGDAAAMIGRLKALVNGIDRRVPVDSAGTMQMQIDRGLSRERMLAFLSALMSAVAVALAAIGLYGVMSYSVTRRTREIGIRLAVGAPRAAVLRGVLRESFWVTAGGVVAGFPLGLLGGRLAQSLLYGITPQDGAAAAFAAAMIGTAALGAALIPAWRAARIDPLRALRWE